MFRSCKLVVVIVGIFVCSTSAVFAQNGKALTLEECIKMGLKNNSNFRNAAFQVDRAGANVTGSYSSILPTISMSLQSGRSTLGQTTNLQNIPQVEPVTVLDINSQPVIIPVTKLDPVTGQPVVDRVESFSPTTSFWGHSLTLRYNQTLFDFGRSFSTIKQAKASFEASSKNLMSARQSVYATIRQRYLELLKAVRLEQEFNEAVARSKGQLNRTQSMYEIGTVALVDVYRQEVTLGNDEISLINQKNTVEIAKGNLNVVMGREPEIPITIEDLNVVQRDPDFTLEEAFKVAEQNNPDLKRFEYEMDSAEYGRRVAKGRYLPSIGVSVLYNRDNQKLDRVYGALNENFFVQFGASFDFNIFNGFSDRAEVGRQSANYSIANENWVNRKRTVRLEVKQSFRSLQAFNEIAKINERNLRAAEEEYRLANERYRVGAGTQLEVTEAQVSLTRARVTLVRAKYDAMISRAQLESAMGVVAEVE